MKLNLSGKRFGRLIGMKPVGKTKWHEIIWLFKCDCGNEKKITGKVVVRGDTSSCGCLATENRSLRIKHGASNTPAYYVWHNMRVRFNYKKSNSFNNYGKRGIGVCKRWENFLNLFKDMGQPPSNMTIERIDNDKGYSINNCRWASRIEQGNNKRNNILITHNGETKTLSQWAGKLGLKYTTLRQRLFVYGWTMDQCINTGYKNCV